MAKYQLFGPGKAEQQEIRRRYVGNTVRSRRSIFRTFFCKFLHHMKKSLSMLCCNPLMHTANCMDPHLASLKKLQFSSKLFYLRVSY